MSLEDAYEIAGVGDALSLNKVYVVEDQRLMKSGGWDYDNPALLINRIKSILVGLDLEALREEEREWCLEILWFWHHHAISCALQKRDKQAARLHAEQALRYQVPNHPNQITRLLYLLVNDRLEQAELWLREIQDEVEQETGAYLLEVYKQGMFL